MLALSLDESVLSLYTSDLGYILPVLYYLYDIYLCISAQGEDYDDDRVEDTIEGEDLDDEGDATVADSDTIDTQGSDTATVADSELKVIFCNVFISVIDIHKTSLNYILIN